MIRTFRWCILAGSLALLTAAPAGAAVPQGFVGVDFNPWEMQDRGVDPALELQRAAAAGVESIRFPLYWFQVQPYSSLERAPAARRPQLTADPQGGAPYDWTALDALMLAAGRLRISVLPTIMGAPRWADDPRHPWGVDGLGVPVPDGTARYAAFCAAVAARYAARSSFWSDHQTAPARVVAWQIWNEPDHPVFWPQYPGERNGPRGQQLGWAPSYLALLRAARVAIKAADPNAKVMLASLLSRPWLSMGQLYSAGGAGQFDSVAANMFTSGSGILARLKTFRSYLDRSGSRNAVIYLTEFSFLSSIGSLPPATSGMFAGIMQTPAGVARLVGPTLSALAGGAAPVRLAGVYWYSWLSPDSGSNGWDYAGLRRYSGTPGMTVDKPALAAFTQTARRLAGCRVGTVSPRCTP